VTNGATLTLFGVFVVPPQACPTDATCRLTNHSSTLACTCGEGAAVADLYQARRMEVWPSKARAKESNTSSPTHLKRVPA
jgi:hypothetical protein